MDKKTYKKLLDKYSLEIHDDVENKRIKLNADNKYKKSKIVAHDEITGKAIRIQGEGYDEESCIKDFVDKYCKYLEPVEKAITKKTFEEAATEWYEANIKDGKQCEKSKKTYYANLFNHIVPYFKDIYLESINPHMCQMFMNGFMGQGESHVSKIHMTLKSVLLFAMENEYIPYRPYKLKFKLPQTKEDEVKEPLTEEELEWVVKMSEKHHAGAMVITMLSCGLRPCEIRHITFDCIDFEKKTLRVKESKTQNGENRILPLPDFCLELIQKEKDEFIEKGLKPKYLFHQKQDWTKPHTESSFYPAWNNFLREIDIANGAVVYRNQITESTYKREISPYYLRHTFCTIINDSNLNDFYIKRLMGHSLKGSIAASIYTHTSDDKIIEHAQGYIKLMNEKFNKILNR